MTQLLRHKILGFVCSLWLASTAMGADADSLKVVHSPAYWIVGQSARLVVQTPADCERLEISHPSQLRLVDRWSYRPGDTTQRFYFQATEILDRGEIVFKSSKYELRMPIRILAWSEVLGGRLEGKWPASHATLGGQRIPRLFPLEGDDDFKAGISLMSPEEFARDRDILRNMRGQAMSQIAKAEELERIFNAIPESTLPRTCFVNNGYIKGAEGSKGCPICGTKVFEGRSSFHPWVLDPEGHPFQVQCPECSRWFPSNKIAEGDMHGGAFPDDGWGYVDKDGKPFSFVGYYMEQTHHDHRVVPTNYSNYYGATGDRRWGRATALVLFRLAEQHLNLALNLDQREGPTRYALWNASTPDREKLSLGASGFYVCRIGTIGLESIYARALERIWDYFDHDDPVILKFLQDHHHPEIKTMADVRRFIEIGYFRTVAQGVLDGAVVGNGASVQSMALNLALILNSRRSIDLVRWAYENPENGMRYYLTNNFFKDGSGYESPGYNNAHYGSAGAIADLLTRVVALRPQQYAEANLPSLPESPKFKAIFDHNLRTSLIDRTYANVGDDGDLPGADPLPIRPGAGLDQQLWAKAFRRWPDDVNYARALWDSEKKAPVSQLTDPALRERVTELMRRESPYLNLPSEVLDGFGHVILRSGQDEDQRALWMRYGTALGHRHHDTLTIGFEALKRTFLPEQGYHRGDSHRTEWDMNWAIHYCGQIVGGTEPADDWGRQGNIGGSLRSFADAGWAKLATAGRRPYETVEPPQLTKTADDLLLERSIALVDLSPKHSYAVSVYRMEGGTDHYLSFHGPRGTAEAAQLKLTPQLTGTLAGPDVPYGQTWDSAWGSANRHRLAFSFLTDVQRAPSQGRWNICWDLENQPDVHLKLHSASAPGTEVALCKGKPPGGGKPFELQWVMQHSRGAAPHASQFVEVLEAYEGQSSITEVRPLQIQGTFTGKQRPVAFEVVCGNRVDTVIQCYDPTTSVTASNGVTIQGSFGIWSEEQGQVKRVLLVGGSEIGKGGRRIAAPEQTWNGTIASANYPEKSVIVTPAPKDISRLIGRYVRITNAQGNDVTHRIMAARPTAEGVELSFELDPTIGIGPVKTIHADGITSAVRLMFEGLYYRGKTLSNEGHSAFYKTSGVKKSRIYLAPDASPVNAAESLTGDFGADGNAEIKRFLLYDYGPGDQLSLPNVLSFEKQ
jgi:hypothetical protein